VAEAAIDDARMGEFMGRMAGYMTGAAVCFGVWLGDELGLYRALAEGGKTSEELAEATDCHVRLLREWADAQAAAGLVDLDHATGTYTLSPEATAALVDDSSPVFVARGMSCFLSLSMDHAKIADAFRGDGALAWGEHHPCLFEGTEWTFRTGYRAFLPGEWIPALDGVDQKLSAGAAVADVGCGHGASAIVIATAYPNATVAGFDYHPASINTARKRAAAAGVSDNTTFEVADATSYPGTYDLICFFDCLHDMGDPVGTAAFARDHLNPDGTVLLVEPFCLDDKPANMASNPMAALFYTMSSVICTPNSLSQEVGLGLGAQAGEARLREVFKQAGFSRFRRAGQTPMNLVLEARP
jgi:2-polyprenyl-3-methyl-5-hydroxy-6-metoxy-1,4-benzoquinol methylase